MCLYCQEKELIERLAKCKLTIDRCVVKDFQEMVQVDKWHHDRIIALGDYQGCDVVVMSQAEVKIYMPTSENEVCISISNEWWGELKPKLSYRYKDILQLVFDDVAVGDAHRQNTKGMTDEQALEVIKFFEKYYKTADKIVIHCFGGISRSRSTAATLCKLYGLPFRYTVLNKHVEDQLTKAYNSLR